MSAKPPLPDGYELTDEINDWHHDPDSGKNAHVWTDADDTTCVAVFEFVDETYAKVIDTRAGAGEELFRNEYEIDATGAAYTDAKRGHVRDAVERAIAWMDSTAPEEWSHPQVCEAVFDTPAGYTLERYFHGDRKSIVYYARDGVDECPLRDRGEISRSSLQRTRRTSICTSGTAAGMRLLPSRRGPTPTARPRNTPRFWRSPRRPTNADSRLQWR